MQTLPETSTFHDLVFALAHSRDHLLLGGGNDMGKQTVAEVIHNLGPHKKKPFIAIECNGQEGKMNVDLIAPIKRDVTSIFYNNSERLLHVVRDGTVFVNKMSNGRPEMEKDLLLRLEHAGLRIIENAIRPSTNLVGERPFDTILRREIITIPPLRNRKEDINFFAQHFLDQANLEWNKNTAGFTQTFMDALYNYSWPRNLQQLRDVIRQSVFLSPDGQAVEHDLLPEEIGAAPLRQPVIVLRDVASRAEYELILDALRQCKYNKKQAAKMLNISRKTLYSKLKKATAFS